MKPYGEVALGVECALPVPEPARRAPRVRLLALLGALALLAGALAGYALAFA